MQVPNMDELLLVYGVSLFFVILLFPNILSWFRCLRCRYEVSRNRPRAGSGRTGRLDDEGKSQKGFWDPVTETFGSKHSTTAPARKNLTKNFL